MEYEKDLLDEILKHTSLDYVSQIPHHLTKLQIQKIKNKIPKEAYTKKQWDEAESFCFGKNHATI